MFPFQNLTFDQMVDTYLSRAVEILNKDSVDEWKKIPLFFMFIRGHYSDIHALDDMFGQKFVLVDGESFKQKPWIAASQIERKLGLNPYFTEDRFGQREDGFYCIKSDGPIEKLSCMPSSKGVTGLGKKTMEEGTKEKLTKFYKPSYDTFEARFGAQFSWMKGQ